MANFTEEKINAIWNKAKIVAGQDPSTYRQDIAGAWIQRNKYGLEENFGWEIDHMLPESLGGTIHSDNLQPLQWENNRAKSNDFPTYSTSVSSGGTNYVLKRQSWKFNDSYIETLKGLYPKNKVLNGL